MPKKGMSREAKEALYLKELAAHRVFVDAMNALRGDVQNVSRGIEQIRVELQEARLRGKS